jgi:hypothetical protein
MGICQPIIQVVRTLLPLLHQFRHDLPQESNIAPFSVTKDLLHSAKNKMSEIEITFITGSLVGAGSDPVKKEIDTHQLNLICGILDYCWDFSGVKGCCTFPTRTSSRT